MSIETKSAVRPRLNGDHIVACFPEQYEALLAVKVDRLRTLLSLDANHEVDVFESEKTNFRMRANFTIWKDDPKDMDNAMGFFYAMYDSNDETKGMDARAST